MNTDKKIKPFSSKKSFSLFNFAPQTLKKKLWQNVYYLISRFMNKAFSIIKIVLQIFADIIKQCIFLYLTSFKSIIVKAIFY